MKTVLIKCGGSVMDELSPSFFSSLKALEKKGYHFLFVHGGGPDINQLLNLYQIPHEFVDGLRKTTADAMDIVEMVLAGKSNRKLVEKLETNGFKAIGVNGSDGGLLQADFIDEEKFGYVGEITKVKPELIPLLLSEHLTPVITPIAKTVNGVKVNINADFAAVAIAQALQIDHFIFVTDVDGLVIDGDLVKQISTKEIETYINNGKITGGMVPKVRSAVAAIEKGLQSVWIMSGKKQFINDGEWIGTEISVKERVIR